MKVENKNGCCPELPDGKTCDYLDFVYRLTHYTDVKLDNQSQRVPVEVALHVRVERCSGPLQLGNLVYSTTLLPGEKVRLYTQDRRSRFSFDSETQLSYRHEQSAEEQYYLDSYEKFMSDLDSREDINSSTSNSGSASTDASTSGLLGTIVNGPSATISGSFDASSTKDFMRELSIHAEASHNKSIQMTRESSAIQVGEVSTKTHAEGESESHVESSSRTFHNENRCHSVSYLFYQVDKQQTTKVSIKTIKTRVIDQATPSSVVNKPILTNAKLSVVPTAVLATSSKLPEKIKEIKAINNDNNLRYSAAYVASNSRYSVIQPLSENVRVKALENVKNNLIAANILTKDGGTTEQTIAEFSFEYKTSIPTAGVVVKGCLDSCNVCEEGLMEEIKLDLEHKKLRNKLLEKQVELLEKSQEYRCCPVDEELDDED
ncbi:hypothetical protein FPF71_16145 [Algibacter amylolyticus]|uniref:Uncharacterized protein n=1 Tax=Algibacter amylolyticus TaxID=1608400 RepID=A0A5M7AZA8_9FLAO|nr:hypothetical protein [Algibacter amylolyticus]KAA5821408.1 hypothetical protein F2B50_16145 [Algibacter amylolyticus]MBB5268280.1 hypothetical protein [Algibacter amylolyticus]TSJ72920.1 hypothetical protein FPF71_16145 [Algibacter amylolyticus]